MGPEEFFWLPSACKKEALDEEEEPEDPRQDPYQRLTCEEEEEDEEEDESSQIHFSDREKLEMVTRYLRNTYKYCIWCGTAFDSIEDLNSNCPGNSAAAH